MPTRRLLALLLVSALVLIAARVTTAAPEECGSVTPPEARAAAVAGAQWLVANQFADGEYRYQLARDGRDLGGYNSVRHAGVTMALYQTALETGDERFLDAGDRGLTWMTDRLVARDGWQALDEHGIADLGGAALMLAGLSYRREATNDTSHDETMRALGRFLVSMQRDNGGFYVSINTRTGQVDELGISPYFDGEATWALTRLQRLLPDDRWRAAAARGAHYAATGRDDLDFVPVAPLNDHWGSYAAAEMADWALGDAEVDYSRRVSGRFHLLIRFEAQKVSTLPYKWTHGPDRRAAALGTWVEGQAALTRLARADDRLHDLRETALKSTECGAAVLIARQVHADDPRVDGAWFDSNATRMDDQQHAIAGLLALADLLETEDADR